MQTEVQNVISKARNLVGTIPKDALQMLQTGMEKVKGLADLTPDAREQFYRTCRRPCGKERCGWSRSSNVASRWR